MIAYVYVIGIVDNPVKVGFAADTARRLMGLQIGCPDEMKLFHAIKVTRGAATSVERGAHERLREHHRRGEWFNVTAEEAKAAILASVPEAERNFSMARVIALEGYQERTIAKVIRDHPISPWAMEAYRAYRDLSDSPGDRTESARLNRRIASEVGAPGLHLLESVAFKGADPYCALRRDLKALRVTTELLAMALDVVGREYAFAMECDLLDAIA